MKTFLKRLFAGHTLSREEASEALTLLASGECSDAQIGAFLGALNMRAIAVEELLGFREAMLALAVPVHFDATDAIDVCGTGGDGKNTFNVSTTTSFVLAALGLKVVKHGNYGVSSKVGGSNVVEALGVSFATDSEGLEQQFKEHRICFVHAPPFHPAMKHVAPARKSLGLKTFFNLLGPISNPACPGTQLTGVFHFEIVRLYQRVFQEVGRTFAVIHSLDGYDECSLTGKTIVASSRGSLQFEPADIGLPLLEQKDLHGPDTPQESADLLRAILAGEGTEAQQAVVAANAALALYIKEEVASLREGVATASEVISSGKALSVLEGMVGGRA